MSTPIFAPSPLHFLKRNAGAHFLLKTVGTTAFMWIFFWAYLYLLRHPNGSIMTVPSTWIDRQIPFSIWGLPVYLSLWVYVSLPNFLMGKFVELLQFCWKVATPCALGLLIFYLQPTAIQPNPAEWAAHPSIAFIKQVDAAGNACPSLHVALALFSAHWLHWRLRAIHATRGWLIANWLWCLAIIWSTMAIRQHLVTDVIAGTLLAEGCVWLTRLRAHAMRLT